MNKIIDIGEIVPLMKEQMDNNGKVRFTPKGNSMLPLLRNNMDVVTMSTPELPLAKYSIAFYQRKNGQYIMPRIYKIRGEDYYMVGDAQQVIEGPLKREQIFAVVIKVKRKEKWIEPGDFWWKFFEKVWIRVVPMRELITRIYSFFWKSVDK